jgi:hypothetical protein
MAPVMPGSGCGFGKASREDTGQDVTPEQQVGDVYRLLAGPGGASPGWRSAVRTGPRNKCRWLR